MGHLCHIDTFQVLPQMVHKMTCRNPTIGKSLQQYIIKSNGNENIVFQGKVAVKPSFWVVCEITIHSSVIYTKKTFIRFRKLQEANAVSNGLDSVNNQTSSRMLSALGSP